MPTNNKYLWYSDLHFDYRPPWTIFQFIRHVSKENPSGLFLTGDIASGIVVPYYLELIAKYIKCKVFYCHGNHCLHFTTISYIHNKTRAICNKYSNLIWLTEAGIIHLDDEVALIGNDGWYDVENGSPYLLRGTMDWWAVRDFWKLNSMKERIEVWRDMSRKSAEDIRNKLELAIEQKYKTIFILFRKKTSTFRWRMNCA